MRGGEQDGCVTRTPERGARQPCPLPFPSTALAVGRTHPKCKRECQGTSQTSVTLSSSVEIRNVTCGHVSNGPTKMATEQNNFLDREQQPGGGIVSANVESEKNANYRRGDICFAKKAAIERPPLPCGQSEHGSAGTLRPRVSGERGTGVPAAMGPVHPVLARGAGQGLCHPVRSHDDTFWGPSLCLGVLRMLWADPGIWMRRRGVSRRDGRAGAGVPLAVSPCSGWGPEAIPCPGQRQVLPGAEARSWAGRPSAPATWPRDGVGAGLWLPLLWLRWHV